MKQDKQQNRGNTGHIWWATAGGGGEYITKEHLQAPRLREGEKMVRVRKVRRRDGLGDGKTLVMKPFDYKHTTHITHPSVKHEFESSQKSQMPLIDKKK